MASVNENLKAAFAGESQANRKYTAYASKAEKEGYTGIAKLFRAAADAETVHAINHWRTLGNVKSTLENLKDALEGETYEVEQMYPAFIASADTEGNKLAKNSFHGAIESEKVHVNLYQQAIESLSSGNDIAKTGYFTCETCGYTHAGNTAPDKCPVCNVPASKFREVS